ncbi:cell division protein FtsQ [Pseudoalteromonas nigrifaciens]|uniref:Cell division protein FtsQ n=1 Tax=Pseudoalteromonas nigrifaciens TaxID=28109 RepID=A0AAC9UK49_9GAMM|nr:MULTISPECIES: cell division protein FtsQ/DivIB [Pseudoalteromonas]ASM55116.1 cell division protein FtsQ [Pseudoalteromonas nigrifaciens]MBB1369281.1 FtsQ-type POTRA domain-containing protein [Pseudoalteromonas sp. SR45-4]MBB1405770.1 FtsQ-type POTRA domain-containing protein [Pseudoalteromonas sp. SG44-5]MBE0419769.1 FtsQ-type POTRA domain-containing protein [Pseudoalteromonas nigrifaciens]MBH0091697.1 cell division protein FtsQ/DivIB [Pseudoalteromonas sp. SCQQ13]
MHPLLEKTLQIKQQLNWSLIFGVSFFLAVVIGLVQITTGVSDWLVENKDAQIKHLMVQGNPKYTDEIAIIRAIKKADLTSFFDLNVKHVQQLVQDLPWVASVSVRKQWPDTLQVYVVEHRAVAHWNSDLLLNQNGDAFEAKSNKLSKNLPQLYGPEGSEQEAWIAFQQFDEMLKVNALTLKSLALSERFSWQLWLDNGVRLNLGRKDKAKRVQRFIDVYPRMEKRADAQIDAIDLRYDTGLAVSFKPLQEEQLQNKSKA